MACNTKTAGRRGKWSEIWDAGTLLTHIWDTYDLVVFEVILGSFQCICLKITGNSKTAGRRAKLTDIWDPWTQVIHIRGTFDLVGLKVIFVSFGTLVSKCPITQENGWS